MHPRSRRYTVLTTAGLALALAACSSSNTTSPKPVTPQSLATHYDSIYSALLAAGTQDDSLIATFIAVGVVTPPAFGATQSTFTVTTGVGPTIWKGYTLELASTGDEDSSFITVAFGDDNLQQLIFAESSYNGCGPDGGFAVAVSGLTVGGTDSTFTGSAGLTSVGNACPAMQSGLASASIIDQITENATSCTQATFTVSFSATFYASDNLASLSTASISNATFAGIRLSGTSIGPSRVPPGPSRLAALTARLRNFHVAHAARKLSA